MKKIDILKEENEKKNAEFAELKETEKDGDGNKRWSQYSSSRRKVATLEIDLISVNATFVDKIRKYKGT